MFRNLVNETQTIAETVHRDCAGTIQIACETRREKVDALFIVRKILFDFKVKYPESRENCRHASGEFEISIVKSYARVVAPYAMKRS